MQMVNKEEEEEEDGKEMKAREVEGRKVEIDANEKIRLLLSLIDQVRSGFPQKLSLLPKNLSHQQDHELIPG